MRTLKSLKVIGVGLGFAAVAACDPKSSAEGFQASPVAPSESQDAATSTSVDAGTAPLDASSPVDGGSGPVDVSYFVDASAPIDASSSGPPSAEVVAACQRSCDFFAVLGDGSCTPGDLVVRGTFVPSPQGAGAADSGAADSGAADASSADSGAADADSGASPTSANIDAATAAEPSAEAALNECLDSCLGALGPAPQCVPAFERMSDCFAESVWLCFPYDHGPGWENSDCGVETRETDECISGL